MAAQAQACGPSAGASIVRPYERGTTAQDNAPWMPVSGRCRSGIRRMDHRV